jgi:hypothetical protein
MWHNQIIGGKPMEQVDWISLIDNLGVPIFVSWYLLTRVESRIETLSSSITEMTQVISGWRKSERHN